MTGKWKLVLLVSLIGNLTVGYVGYKAYEYRQNINFWLEKYTFVVDEFSERDEYADANIALRSDTIVPGRIVFFGTQVTKSWPVADLFPGLETINRGVDGQRAAGFLLRFRPDVLELKPEYVVIEVSSYNFRPNTTAAEILDYVKSMADLARAHGIDPILTTAIPPRPGFEVEEHPDYNVKDTVEYYNDRLREYGRASNLAVADWYRAVCDSTGHLRPDLSVNAVDLGPGGYREIAVAVLDLIGSPM